MSNTFQLYSILNNDWPELTIQSLGDKLIKNLFKFSPKKREKYL